MIHRAILPRKRAPKEAHLRTSERNAHLVTLLPSEQSALISYLSSKILAYPNMHRQEYFPAPWVV
jgi:hypothetical protein